MADLMRHVYSTVRVVPDPATGEFANLAAIAGSDLTGEWAIRGLQNERRARQFAGHDAIVAAHDFMARVGLTLDLADWTLDDDIEDDIDPGEVEPSEDTVSESWLRDLASRNRHVVQLSAPNPIMAESVEEALDFVFANVLHEPERRKRHLGKSTLLSRLNLSFLENGLEPGEQFARRALLTAGGTHRFTHPADFVVGEDRAVQLVQAWSFQVESQVGLARDVKAWGWTTRDLREHGGSVRAYGRNLHVPSDIPIEVLLAKPEEDQAVARYEEALAVFDELDVVVREYGDESAVAEDAVRALGGAI